MTKVRAMDRKRWRKLKQQTKAPMAGIVLVLFVMSTGWLADSVLDKDADLWQSLGHVFSSSPARLILPVLLVLVFGVTLWNLRRGLFLAQNLAKLQSVPACRAVIFSLSDFAWGKRLELDNGRPVLILGAGDSVTGRIAAGEGIGSGSAAGAGIAGGYAPSAVTAGERRLALPETLSAAVVAETSNPYSTERIGWQQILKGVLPHRGLVSKVVLIASHENRKDSALAVQWLSFYLGQVVRVECYPESTDFEDVSEVYFAMARIIENLKGEGFEEADIMIDATGGTKVASIAAALASLTYKDLKFQYVTKAGKVIAFNATFANEPELG
jgi:hypothetical protein